MHACSRVMPLPICIMTPRRWEDTCPLPHLLIGERCWTQLRLNLVIVRSPCLTQSSFPKHGCSPMQIIAPSTVRSRVAYQGVPGAYSEGAARKACPDAEPLPCDQFEVAFQALAQWLADTAVLPIENSLGGSIHTVFDLLIKYAVPYPCQSHT